VMVLPHRVLPQGVLPQGGDARAGLRERGFTLVELMVAMGILAMLSIFLVRILTQSLAIWNWGEERASLQARGSAALEQGSEDFGRLLGLRTVSYGLGRREAMQRASAPRAGRLVSDFLPYGQGGRVADPEDSYNFPRKYDWYPRVRMVVRFSRLEGHTLLAEDLRAQILEEEGGQILPELLEKQVREALAETIASDVGEVELRVVPDADAESPYLSLYRSRRLLDEDAPRRWVDGGDAPTLGAPIVEHLLYMEMSYRSQLTESYSSRSRKAGPESCWDSARAGLFALDHPVLRFSLDLDQASLADPLDDVMPLGVRILAVVSEGPDFANYALLDEGIDSEADSIRLSFLNRLPDPEVQNHVKIGKEWIRFTAVQGNRLIGLTRGVRNTRARAHNAGSRIYGGLEVKLTLPISVAREYWNG
jgi:prepilin-type N-terminal cleavage/methylation domain-containing protein